MTLAVGPGDVLDGKYVIERLLGQGGMGAVFIAHEEQLARRVAIKVLLPEVVSNGEGIARFEREARAAASLESEHVTRVLSVGRLADGLPYIVMELLEGEDLSAVLARRGPLPAHEVAGIMVHACDALAEAHARGIVHRDLKPANLFYARRANGRVLVKVLDFGISKANAPSPTAKGLTATTALMGTPVYMSPEQLREARNVDGRADIWALGITMYELLAGAPPFAAEGLAELCVQVLTTDHPPLRSRRPDVPPALEAVVDRCLRKDVNERFASAAELSDALGRIGPTAHAATPAPLLGTSGHASSAAHAATAAASAAGASAPMTVDGVTQPSLPPKRSAGAALVVVGGAALLLAGVGTMAVRFATRSSSTDANGGAASSTTAASSPASDAAAPVTAPPLATVPTEPVASAPPRQKHRAREAAGVASERATNDLAVTLPALSAAASSRPIGTKPSASSTPTVPLDNGPPPLPRSRR